MPPVVQPESSCLPEAAVVVGIETMIGDRGGGFDLGRIIWPTEPRRGRIFVRSRTVARRGEITQIATATMRSGDTNNTSGPERYGVGVRVLILLRLRLKVAGAMRRKHRGISRGDVARADRAAGAGDPPRHPLLHRPVDVAVAVAVVRRAGVGGVKNVVVGVLEEGAVRLAAAGEAEEVDVSVARPPAVIQAQVVAAVVVAVSPVPRRHRPLRRDLDLDIARSVVGVGAHRMFRKG